MEVQFKVVSKTQGLDNEGNPLYYSTFQPLTEGTTGSFVATATDSAIDDYFTLGTTFTATIAAT